MASFSALDDICERLILLIKLLKTRLKFYYLIKVTSGKCPNDEMPLTISSGTDHQLSLDVCKIDSFL